MSAPVKKCKVCLGTGEVRGEGFLDCTSCEVAEQRAELEAWAEKHCADKIPSWDLWLIYQHGLAAAPVVPVAAQPTNQPEIPDSSNSVEIDGIKSVAAQPVVPADPRCGACLGSGWVSRDTDIGTEQECFSCDGTGKSDDPAPSLEAQPAGEVVYQVQHTLGPDWTDVTKPVYDKWWRENRRVIHLTAMAQGEKHE